MRLFLAGHPVKSGFTGLSLSLTPTFGPSRLGGQNTKALRVGCWPWIWGSGVQPYRINPSPSEYFWIC